jgi:hypothetical protein
MRHRPHHRKDRGATKDRGTTDETKSAVEDLMEIMFRQGKAQFGDAVKSFWFYDDELCPGCMSNPIGVVKFRGKDSVPINGFMYRERGVLIGYFLCGTCAETIHSEAKKNPYKETPLHADIERNLIAGYHKHLSSLNA